MLFKRIPAQYADIGHMNVSVTVDEHRKRKCIRPVLFGSRRFRIEIKREREAAYFRIILDSLKRITVTVRLIYHHENDPVSVLTERFFKVGQFVDGIHHVAQKLSTIGFPKNCDRVTAFPSVSVTTKSGARFFSAEHMIPSAEPKPTLADGSMNVSARNAAINDLSFIKNTSTVFSLTSKKQTEKIFPVFLSF